MNEDILRLKEDDSNNELEQQHKTETLSKYHMTLI